MGTFPDNQWVINPFGVADIKNFLSLVSIYLLRTEGSVLKDSLIAFSKKFLLNQ